METSPNTANYPIGKGSVWFKKEGDAEFRHMGNVAEFELELDVETLEHFSSMEGVRVKDLEVVLEITAALRVLLDEWTDDNLEIMLLGEKSTNTEGAITIDIGTKDLVRGAVKFVANNQRGPKWDWLFPSVAFRPSGAISPISNEWGQLEITGEVEAVEGKFGTTTLQVAATETE